MNKNKILIIRICISLIFFIIGIILEYKLDNSIRSELIYLSFYIVSYLIVGINVLFRAIINIFKGKLLDECFLMTIATIGAFLMRLFNDYEYKEAVAIMIFYQIGEVFEGIAVERSKNKILDTLKLTDTKTTLIDGTIKDAKDVNVGDILLIKPGEMVLLDGISMTNGLINTESLTGESIDIDINVGDVILSGSINRTIPINLEVTKRYEESTQTKILDLVENATMYKSKSEKFISKFARVYTPIVVIIALLLAIGFPTILGFIHGFSFSDYRVFIKESIICLVISCPCALVVSIPLTYFSSVGAIARKKIIVKGSSHIENLSLVDTVILDKTGTLTKGEFNVSNIIGDNKEELIKIAKGLEINSTHPLAKAINLLDGIPYKFDIEEAIGFGIIGKMNNDTYILGSKKLLHRYNIDVLDNEQIGSRLYIAKNDKHIGTIVLEDKIKEEAFDVINKLQEKNIRIVVLSGDTLGSVKSLCDRLNIKEYYYQLLPEEKVNILSNILKDNNTKKVLYTGDGINDAPVLEIADIGVSMGALGSDSAIEASDIVLLNDDLNSIPLLLNHSKRTKIIVYENIFISLFVKIIILILSIVSVFYDKFELPMFIAIFGDVGILILAILNSLRAFKIKE